MRMCSLLVATARWVGVPGGPRKRTSVIWSLLPMSWRARVSSVAESCSAAARSGNFWSERTGQGPYAAGFCGAAQAAGQQSVGKERAGEHSLLGPSCRSALHGAAMGCGAPLSSTSQEHGAPGSKAWQGEEAAC